MSQTSIYSTYYGDENTEVFPFIYSGLGIGYCIDNFLINLFYTHEKYKYYSFDELGEQALVSGVSFSVLYFFDIAKSMDDKFIFRAGIGPVINYKHYYVTDFDEPYNSINSYELGAKINFMVIYERFYSIDLSIAYNIANIYEDKQYLYPKSKFVFSLNHAFMF